MDNVVATLGTACTAEQLRLLRQFDDSARNLLLRGYTRQELIKRLEQEENHA